VVNSSLATLYLTKCQITDVGVKALAAGAGSSPTLKTLLLDYNWSVDFSPLMVTQHS